MTNENARSLIASLVDAGYTNALAGCQDGGEHVDIVFSRKPGRKNTVMSMDEAEQLLDRAIRAAYKKLTGRVLSGDPVEFMAEG